MERKKAAIIGHLGAFNVGDELMLKGLFKCINPHKPWIFYVFVKHLRGCPERDTVDGHSVRFVKLTTANLLSILRKTDVVIKCGGTSFHDYRRRVKFTILVARWLTIFLLARFLGNKLYLIGIGPGPINGRLVKILSRTIFRLSESVTIRDSASFNLVTRDLNFSTAQRSTDLCMATLPTILRSPSLRLGSETSIIGVSLLPFYRMYGSNSDRDRDLVTDVANAINAVASKCHIRKVTIFACNGLKDVTICEQLDGRLDSDSSVQVYRPDREREFLDAFRLCDTVLCSRLHSLLIAYLYKCKTVLVSYHPKCDRFASEIGLDSRFVIPIDSGRLCDELAKTIANAVDMGILNYENRDQCFSRLVEVHRDALPFEQRSGDTRSLPVAD